jgi:two-component system chemotaxis response regulator CheB
MTRRDIIVIGASAGGVSALQDVARGLPHKLPASIFVVVHSSPRAPGLLPAVLSKVGPLPAIHATDGQRFRRGCIYVAPPDHHLLFDDGVMRVTTGPRENGFRPAVDPLFRTAAEQHGARVIGIVLSGALDDGTRGLQSVKRHGGVAIAQQVEDATIPSMPLSAIRHVEVDHILPAAEMPAVIAHLASGGTARMPRKRRTHTTPRDVAQRGSRRLERGTPGPPTPFTCPECGGTLWEHSDDKVTSYACHVGHSYSAEALGAGLEDRVEMAMWTAFRTLEEGVLLQRQLADRARARGLAALAHGHDERARASAERAEIIQRALVGPPPRRRPRSARARRTRRASDE